MLVKDAPENADKRYKRYQHAANEYVYIRSRLEDLYDYFAPLRTSFNRSSGDKAPDRGSGLTTELYDGTAQEAIVKYANNIQSALMPPYRRWHNLKPSSYLTTQYGENSVVIQQLTRSLETINNILFKTLYSTNSSLAINESFIDMGISTGIIFLNDNISDVPFSFVAIPPDRVVFSEDPYCVSLQNFWHIRSLTLRAMRALWGDDIMSAFKDISYKEDEKINVIEGCIYYPDHADKKYLYYVQLEEKKIDLYSRWLSYCPYTGFRAYKRSGEVWGRGVADRIFPFVKLLNKLSEYSLRAIKFTAYPLIGIQNSMPGFNASTVKIEPGAIINLPMPSALQKIDLGGNPQISFVTQQQLVNTINTAFFVNPLGDIGQTPGRTATEMQIRQQNWLRENAVSLGRLESEIIRPLLNKCLIVLREKGIIADPIVNGQQMKIGENKQNYEFEFESPLVGLQNQDDMANMDAYIQRMLQLYGAPGVMLLNNEKIPNWYGNKANIPLSLIKNENEVEDIINGILQAFQQNKEQLESQQLQSLAGRSQPPTPQGTSNNLQNLLQG